MGVSPGYCYCFSFSRYCWPSHCHGQPEVAAILVFRLGSVVSTAQFRMRHVTAQRTKFYHVVSSLSPDFATEVRDFIIRPPADAPYDSLREQLIKCTTASEQRKLQQLFSAEELGDRKPSQLLSRLQQLMGERASATDNTFLWELFLKRLPGNVRMILASTASSSSLDELTDLADKIMDVVVPSVSALQPPPPQLNAEVDQQRTEVTHLKGLVKSLTVHQRTHSSHRPSTPRHRSPPQSPVAGSTC